ncbi:MAG: hypothetical protein RLZZ361_912 [Cyanobacteriota bacterium]|jgi:SAM-dependent methyltransferase
MKEFSENRIIGAKVDINSKQIKHLFNSRALNSATALHAVMLQNKDSELPIIRDNFERMLIRQKMKFYPSDNVLDLGCGAGRLVNFFYDEIKSYFGFDFSSELIRQAFKHHKEKNSCYFFEQDICQTSDIDYKTSSVPLFDKIFLIGICMYLNDSDLMNVLKFIKTKIKNDGVIYIRESISKTTARLSLNNYFSQNLSSEYSAIYRTEQEFLDFCFTVFKDSNFKLIDSDYFVSPNGLFQETCQKYFIFKG